MLEQVAHYNLLELVGTGGMGEVYRARDTRLGRTVAVKVPPDTIVRDARRRGRFLRDARAATAISHPSIATLFDVLKDGEDVFLVFEYVPGRSLAAEIGGRPLGTRTALDLAVQLAEAVAAAHGVGVIHRDLKPDNILITSKGRAKILDFGLATWTRGGAARDTAVTQLQAGTDVVTGTLAYMSPEQAAGSAVDERTDIFSLGIVIFEMLTGRNPFARPGAGLLAATAIVRDPAPPPSRVNPNLPKELDQILGRALAKEPGDRYQTAATMAAELRALSAILDVRSGDSEPLSVVPARPRRSVPWGWMAALLVLTTLATTLWLWRGRLEALWSRYAGPPPAPILAVIPESLEAEFQYVTDGLAADLVTRLGQTPGITVLGRSASREYRAQSPAAVAAELGAKAVLMVSARRQGDTLRVRVGLLDPSVGMQVWGGQFDRPVGDVFAVQSEISGQVARVLGLSLAPSAARARTASRRVDPRAYESYLRGRDAAAQGAPARAAVLYRQAVDIDPALAEAQAGLAEALYLLAVGARRLEYGELLAEAHVAATAAVAVDPDLPQAHLALGLVSETLAVSLAHLRRARELDPSYGEAARRIGEQVRGLDPGRAIPFFREALDVDPRMTTAWSDLASAHRQLGELDEAERDIDRGRQLNPEGRAWPLALALLRLAQGRAAEALAAAALAGDSADASVAGPDAVLSVYALHALGRVSEATTLSRAKVEQDPTFCEGQAILAALQLGQGQAHEARALVAPVFERATHADAAPAAVACSAMAAAAIDEPARAAAALRAIAASEAALRLWCLDDHAYRLGWLPWGSVLTDPPFVEAAAVLDEARARLRAVAADALKDLR